MLAVVFFISLLAAIANATTYITVTDSSGNLGCCRGPLIVSGKTYHYLLNSQQCQDLCTDDPLCLSYEWNKPTKKCEIIPFRHEYTNNDASCICKAKVETLVPTSVPTFLPTNIPTALPTQGPTKAPTSSPTQPPPKIPRCPPR